jgi:quercetin dioxygenase-like cupin family protein
VKQRTTLALCLMILTLILPMHGGAAPPSPSVRYDTNLANLTMPGAFTLIARVRDFAPGAWTTVHIHGGPVLVTVLEGELTLRIHGGEQKYQKGGSWVELPGIEHVHEVGNTGPVMASALGTTLLPDGAQETTTIDSGGTRPGPTVKYQATFERLSIDGAFTEFQRIVDFPPGAWTSVHVHGGPRFVLVLGGEMTLRINGTEQVYKAGQSFLEPPGVVHSVGNAGVMPSYQVSLTLLPKGAPEMTNLQGGGAPLPSSDQPFFIRRLGDS